MCEFTQGIRGSYQNAGVMMCLMVTYKQYVLKLREKNMRPRSQISERSEKRPSGLVSPGPGPGPR